MRTNQLAEGAQVAFSMWAMPGTVFGFGLAVKTQRKNSDPEAAIGEHHWGGLAGMHSWMAPQADLTGFCLTQRMPGFWLPFSHEFKARTSAAAS